MLQHLTHSQFPDSKVLRGERTQGRGSPFYSAWEEASSIWELLESTAGSSILFPAGGRQKAILDEPTKASYFPSNCETQLSGFPSLCSINTPLHSHLPFHKDPVEVDKADQLLSVLQVSLLGNHLTPEQLRLCQPRSNPW